MAKYSVSPEQVDPLEFRKATGLFTTGITVITASDGEQARGMTANSFVSVSLDPPLVLVSIANTAKMHDLVKRTGSYGISVLSADQLSHSKLFAGGKGDVSSLQFDSLAGVPILENCLSSFACDLHQEVEAGDHTLFIGHVRELAFREADPLVYFASGYKAIASASAVLSV
ncbi:MAG: flavin reductase family protein [Pseudomonadota bacterium]